MNAAGTLTLWIILTGSLFFPQNRASRSDQGVAQPGSASGVVLAQSSRVPITNCGVIVSSVTDPAVVFSTLSDDQGVFTFGEIPAGRYAIRAMKDGWVGPYNSLFSGYLGAPLNLTAGQRVSDVTLRLLPGAVLGGTVRNDSGEPAQGVEVRVLRFVAGLGIENAVGNTANKLTDDLGQFRVYGLAPGEYVVVALPQVSLSQRIGLAPRRLEKAGYDPRTSEATSKSEQVDYAPVFFPSTTDVAGARPVSVDAGQVRLNVDIQMRLVNVVTLRGVVRAGPGVESTPDSVQVALAAAAEGWLGLPRTTTATRDGSFEFRGVAPGTYSITAKSISGQANVAVQALASAGRLYAAATATVSQGDVALDLELLPGATIDGLIEPRGVASFSPEMWRTAAVSLVPADRTGTIVPAVLPDDKGRFSLKDVPPGRYRVLVTPPRSNETAWFVEQTTFGGSDLMNGDLQVPPNGHLEDLRVGLTREAADLRGTLQVPPRALPLDYLLVVFPVDRSKWARPGRGLGQTRPSASGAYAFPGLQGGSYYLAVVQSPVDLYTFGPAVLDQLVPMAVKVELRLGQRTTQDLKVPDGHELVAAQLSAVGSSPTTVR